MNEKLSKEDAYEVEHSNDRALTERDKEELRQFLLREMLRIARLPKMKESDFEYLENISWLYKELGGR